MMNFKNKAFTLAEVLITLSIIGVIAAMTIPSLMINIQDQASKTQYKKTYAVLENAVRMMATNNGGTLADLCTGENSSDCFKNELVKYLNVQKSCDYNESGDNECCNTITVDALGGCCTWYPELTKRAAIVLNNGTVLSISWNGPPEYPEDAHSEGPIVGDVYGEIVIDTNGNKEPNIRGKNIFYIYLTKTGIKPYGTQGDWTSGYVDDCNKENIDATGITCAAEYLKQ